MTFLPHCTTCSCTAPPPAAASGVNRLRSVIDAWVTALGLDRSPEVHHDTGRIHLRAEAKDLWGRGVGVVVMADVWEDHPAD